MKSLDLYYCVSLAVIILCAAIMTNRKLDVSQEPNIQNVLIVGCNIESAYIASLLQKNKCLNVTVLDEGECSREGSFTFVEGSYYSKRLVDSINFRYTKIPESYGFWDGENLQRINEPSYRLIYQYGLSQYALKDALGKIKQALHRLPKHEFDSIEKLFSLFRINSKAKAAEYLLYDLGLDREYVRDFVYPFLYGHYLQEMQLNLLTVMLKLLELFYPSYEVIGTESDIVLRLLSKTNYIEHEPLKELSHNSNTSLFTAVTANLVIENISSVIYCNYSRDSKEWHYSTELKGHLSRKFYSLTTDDDELPLSIYSPDSIPVIRKYCQNCRRSLQHRYTLKSKFRLGDRDLKMFQSHEILNSTRLKIVKYSQPDMSRLSDGLGNYYPNLAYTVSDSRELTLAVAESVARMLL